MHILKTFNYSEFGQDDLKNVPNTVMTLCVNHFLPEHYLL